MKGNGKNITDQWELIGKTVESHMRPFIQATMVEHEETRKRIKSVEDLVKKTTNRRVEIFQNVAIAILFLAMLFLLTGCKI